MSFFFKKIFMENIHLRSWINKFIFQRIKEEDGV